VSREVDDSTAGGIVLAFLILLWILRWLIKEADPK
jgi:hypothetical protein